jgi:hypothetical protein
MIMDGDLMYNIKEIIKKDKIDYIVMGTSGATGWKEAFLGTNTGEAIVNLSVPVLSVPKDCEYTKIIDQWEIRQFARPKTLCRAIVQFRLR